MILFFNGVSTQGYIGLYGPEKNPICHDTFTIAGNESNKCLGIIMDFLEKNSLRAQDLTQIVCVTGPGSFTGVRTISLVINSFAYSYPHIGLSSLSFFDLYQDFPIARASSKRDMFVKKSKSATIEIVKNEDFEDFLSTQSCVYGDIPDAISLSSSMQVFSDIDYDVILANTNFQNLKKLAPLYIKKPNIS